MVLVWKSLPLYSGPWNVLKSLRKLLLLQIAFCEYLEHFATALLWCQRILAYQTQMWSLILFLMLKLLKPWSFLYCFTNRFHLTIYSLKIFQLETWEYRRTKFDLTVCCKIISHFSHIPYDSVFSFIVLRYKSSLPHAVFFINVNKNDSIHFSSKLSVAYLRACKHICDVYGILLLFEQSWT